MKRARFSIKQFCLHFLKVNVFLLTCKLLTFQTLSAQVPYTPFPTDSLSWHIKGENIFDPYSAGYAEFTLIGKDTAFDGQNYAQVVDVQEEFIVGIREEEKKIYVYIPDFGEHLLYDFNLEVGDTIFYNVAFGFSWVNFSIHTHCFGIEHYAVVTEKGVTTLMDGSIRNTLTIWDEALWIEGLGTTGWMGLLNPNPLIAVITPDGSSFEFVCVNNKKSMDVTGKCIVHVHDSDEDCPCSPWNGIEEGGEFEETTLYPNPTTGELRIANHKSKITQVEVFDILGKQMSAPLAVSYAENMAEIDISHVKAGAYFIRVKTDKGVMIRKIIKH